jgi:hypothetical protein
MKTFLLAIVVFCCGIAAAGAAPDFSQSTIEVSSEAPLEADVVRFTVRLKNSGDALAEHAQLEIEWPLMGYLLGFEGLEGAKIDEASRSITGSISLYQGTEKIVIVDVMTPRDSGGDALTLAVHLGHHLSGTNLWDRKTVTIDTRLPDSGVKAGGFGIPVAGLLVILWMVLAIVIWLGVRALMGGRDGANGAAAALAIAIGFWMIFAAMAWRDYEVLNKWPETVATIVGRRDKSETIASSHKNASGVAVNSESEIITPEFALRYEVDGKTIFSTGYDTGSSIRVGGRVRREQEMRDWVRGARIPCWYNPRDPYDVVVRRGFGGAYVFVLFPLPVFGIGIAILRGRKKK